MAAQGIVNDVVALADLAVAGVDADRASALSRGEC
jgi:hypothetical protein